MRGAGLWPGIVNQQHWELSCLLLDSGTEAGRGYVGFIAMVPHLTQGNIQMAIQAREDRGCVGGGSVQSLRSVPSSMLRWLQGRLG